MKKVLIISPYFPPVNAADMHRVRTSLPYFSEFGWDAAAIIVDPEFTDTGRDELLNQLVPADIKIHKVKALSKKLTGKVGLGSIALRSIPYYRSYVDRLLAHERFDLIYFSTTQFPVCVLGAYWKKKFNIPYVIDMQDPWHSDHYRHQPKQKRPPKYWFSYRLNKYLEPIALKAVSGLISVSDKYITDLKSRYPQIKNVPAATITFGAFEPDMQIAAANQHKFTPLLDNNFINVVYVGRGGADMHKAITPLFKALATATTNYQRLKIYFIGTSYAPAGQGLPTIAPLAKTFGLESQVVEITDRIPYYHSLLTLQQADALFIPGSDDPGYTASKIYPYLMLQKPVLAIFNQQSPAVTTLKEFGLTTVFDYDTVTTPDITHFLNAVINGTSQKTIYNNDAVIKHAARYKTGLQCALFDQVINE